MSDATSSVSWRNGLLAVVALVLGVVLFLGLQTQANPQSLEAQSQKAVPWEIAQTNGKPTLLEFYADWCTSCQAMASTLGQLKQEFGDRVNFVMLNVDNNKWLPEVLRYRVDGIPHFVFFDGQGENLGEAIGEQPESILQANLQAQIAQTPLPYRQRQGQVSPIEATPLKNQTSDPRDHGGDRL